MIRPSGILFFLLLSTALSAQRNVVKNLAGFDEHRKYHFGFYVGANSMGGKVRLDEQLFRNDTIYSFNLKPKTGFNLGVVIDLHLGDFFDLRSLFPTLSFGQRDFIYRVRVDESNIFEDVRQVESTYLAWPLEFKYKSKRYGNFRMYLLGGAEAAYDLVSQKNVDSNDKSIVRLNRLNYGYSYGFGLEFFLEFFKFAPQIKWTNGLNNLLINDQTPFTNVIDRINSKIVLISLTFEG